MSKKKVKEIVTETDVKCSECGSDEVIKAGWNWRNRKKDVQRYRCNKCGKVFVLPAIPKNGEGEINAK